jgi:copper resistance protein B
MKHFHHIAPLVSVLAVAATTAHAYEPAGTPPDWDPPMGKPMLNGRLLTDRMEAGFDDEIDTYVWDVQGWYGGDRDRLWLKSEGEGEQGKSPESAELQVLYSHLFSPFWDWQVGLRQDFKPTPNRTSFVLGLQGVVPYEFEWDSALFVSDEGNLSARVEAEYDLNITQRWVLQPRMEVNAAFSEDRAIGVGTGVNSSELGLRLRYHFRREFAPYVGISWENLYGDTKDFAQDEGEPTTITSVVVGLRLWF